MQHDFPAFPNVTPIIKRLASFPWKWTPGPDPPPLPAA